MNRMVLRVAVAAAVTVSLAACGSGDEGAASSSTSLTAGVAGTSEAVSTTAAVASASTVAPEPPAMPEAAKVNNQAGAEAFALWYFEALNYSSQHPQTPPPDVAEASCTTCANYVKTVAALANDEQHYGGPIFDAKITKTQRLGSRYLIVMDMTELKYSVIDKSGSVVENVPSEKLRYQPDVQWMNGSWRILEIRTDRK